MNNVSEDKFAESFLQFWGYQGNLDQIDEFREQLDELVRKIPDPWQDIVDLIAEVLDG